MTKKAKAPKTARGNDAGTAPGSLERAETKPNGRPKASKAAMARAAQDDAATGKAGTGKAALVKEAEAKVTEARAADDKATKDKTAKIKGDRNEQPDKQMMLITRAIADPRRMAILRAIAQNRVSCGELLSCTGISAATLSHHMKELDTAGLIDVTRQGRYLKATLHRKVWKSYVASLKALAD